MVEKSEKDQTNYYLRNILGEFSAGDKFSLYKGTKRYELTNHLGNVLSVVSDELTPNGEAQVISAKDYYPFGMSMPGRTTEGGTYRYGFNGKETDQETGIQDYGMRWYLPNIARFPSVDPLTAKYPELTPYQFASNTPIVAIDIDGLESDVDFNGVPPTEEPMSLTVQEQLDIINKNYIKQPSHFSFKSIEVTYNAITENAQEYISIHEYDANNPTHHTQGKYKYRDYQLTIYLTQVKINGIVTSRSVSFTYDLDEFTDGSCVDTNDEAGQSALAWGTACLNEESVVALPSPMMKEYGLWPGDFGIIEYQGKTSFPYIGDNSWKETNENFFKYVEGSPVTRRDISSNPSKLGNVYNIRERFFLGTANRDRTINEKTPFPKLKLSTKVMMIEQTQIINQAILTKTIKFDPKLTFDKTDWKKEKNK